MAGNTIGQLFRVTTFGESHGIASVSYTHLRRGDAVYAFARIFNRRSSPLFH